MATITKICEICGKEFETHKNCINTCSPECKRAYINKKNKEKTLLKYPKEKVCPQCGKHFMFDAAHRNQKFCCTECADIFQNNKIGVDRNKRLSENYSPDAIVTNILNIYGKRISYFS